MPSPLGEGQTDTPINHLYLGEVSSLFLRTIPTIKISDRFIIPKLTQHTPAMGTERRAVEQYSFITQIPHHPLEFALQSLYSI